MSAPLYVTPSIPEPLSASVQRKRVNHNETEKRRIKTMNNNIDELRRILSEAGISFKGDKVSTLDAVATYMRSLIKERDRLTTSLCYMEKVINQPVTSENEDQEPMTFGPSPFQSNLQQDDFPSYLGQSYEDNTNLGAVPHLSDMGESTSSMQSSDLPVLGDLYEPYKSKSFRSKDPDRYKGHSLMRRIIEAEREEQGMPGSPASGSLETATSEQSSVGITSIGMNYKDVWMKNNMATVVVNLRTGQLLKGNTAFMKLFQFATVEELNSLTIFDLIVVSDLAQMWGEASQLVNSSHYSIRSFNLTVANDRRNIRLPCLLTMGPIMDMEGYYCQVSITFTPLQQVSHPVAPECDAIGSHCTTLPKLV